MYQTSVTHTPAIAMDGSPLKRIIRDNRESVDLAYDLLKPVRFW
jgi:hypothetical protein